MKSINEMITSVVHAFLVLHARLYMHFPFNRLIIRYTLYVHKHYATITIKNTPEPSSKKGVYSETMTLSDFMTIGSLFTRYEPEFVTKVATTAFNHGKSDLLGSDYIEWLTTITEYMQDEKHYDIIARAAASTEAFISKIMDITSDSIWKTLATLGSVWSFIFWSNFDGLLLGSVIPTVLIIFMVIPNIAAVSNAINLSVVCRNDFTFDLNDGNGKTDHISWKNEKNGSTLNISFGMKTK